MTKRRNYNTNNTFSHEVIIKCNRNRTIEPVFLFPYFIFKTEQGIRFSSRTESSDLCRYSVYMEMELIYFQLFFPEREVLDINWVPMGFHAILRAFRWHILLFLKQDYRNKIVWVTASPGNRNKTYFDGTTMVTYTQIKKM